MTTISEDKKISELHKRICECLAAGDYRYTISRKRLVEALASSDRPLTLPDIVTVAPDLPTSSIYRNLEVLERAGVTRRIVSGGHHAHFELAEPFNVHHHHLVCTLCGHITDMQLDDTIEESLVAALTQVAKYHGFEPQEHNIDLLGHCGQCNS